MWAHFAFHMTKSCHVFRLVCPEDQSRCLLYLPNLSTTNLSNLLHFHTLALELKPVIRLLWQAEMSEFLDTEQTSAESAARSAVCDSATQFEATTLSPAEQGIRVSLLYSIMLVRWHYKTWLLFYLCIQVWKIHLTFYSQAFASCHCFKMPFRVAKEDSAHAHVYGTPRVCL